MLFTIVIILSTFLFLRLSYKRYNFNKRLKGFVSPPGHPIFGHLFTLTSKLGCLPNLIDASRKYGRYLKLELFFGISFLVITDKEFISRVLNGYPLIAKNAMYDVADKWLGDSIVVSKPEKWKKIRKITTPAFSVQSLENYIKLFDTPCKTLIGELKKELNGDAFDIFHCLVPCTLEITTASIMGIKLDAHKDLDYINDSEEIARIAVRRIFNPFKKFLITYMCTRDFWNERKIAARIRNFTKGVIESRRRIKAKNVNEDIGRCLLDTLLEAEYDGKPLTDKQMMDEVQTFVFAGHDTTATCISFCLYCLSQYADVQDNVVKELESIFGNDNRTPTTKDLSEMRYLEMVIKESMRLYTAVPFIGRQIEEDLSFGKVFIPKGQAVMFFLPGVHMNPTYHPDPERFDPSRFESNTTAFTFVAFGAGPRNCIGQRFGMMTMKYVVCQVLRNFKILPVHGHVPQQALGLLLRFQNGILISLQAR